MKPKLKKTITPIGRSTQGHSIDSYTYGDAHNLQSPRVLVMSGLHGDEIEGITLNNQLSSALLATESPILQHATFLAVANPDANFLHQRWNANDVDLNRNFATANWTPTILNPRYPPGPSAASEPETKALSDFIIKSKFNLVLDLHSYKESALLPLYFEKDHFLEKATDQLGLDQKIPIYREQIGLGYETTGGLEAWCKEHQVHNLTVEIEKGIGQFAIAEKYLKPLLTFLNSYCLAHT